MAFWDGPDVGGELREDFPVERPADPRGSSGRGRFAAGTPEDVAALYTWANLQGARYRDFSASRRRYREQIRNQAEHAGASSDGVEEGRREPPADAMPASPRPSEPGLEERRRGGSAVRWAAGRRGWESSSRSVGLDEAARRSDSRNPDRSGERGMDLRPLQAATDRPMRPSADSYPPGSRTVPVPGRDRRADAQLGDSSYDPMYRGPSDRAEDDRWERMERDRVKAHRAEIDRAEVDRAAAYARRGFESEPGRGSDRPGGVWAPGPADDQPDFEGPAWLYGRAQEPVSSRVSVPCEFERYGDESRGTGKNSRPASGDATDRNRATPRQGGAVSELAGRAQLLVLFSLSGGVGRTSLLATLGRALSASGERVVLGDGAGFSLLPFYFGGDELSPGELRGFAPPQDSTDAPILMANYELARVANDLKQQRQMVGEILRNGLNCHRILLDIPPGAEWLMRRLATLQPTVLVPLLADMRSVISLETVERYFDQFDDEDGNPVRPFYLLNQFDGGLKLHRHVLELLRSRLGDRLLSFAVRRSAAVSEALAQGMTVADYAPGSAVTRDYLDLAAWVRTLSPAVGTGTRLARSGRG